MIRCECGVELPTRAGRGRRARYCSSACRQRAYRARQLPAALAAGVRWVRADGKRPITLGGRPASSTDPLTWSTIAAVRASDIGDGFGVMLGAGLGCYDLDHVADREARAIIAKIPEPIVYVERSMSGTGVHVFVEAEEGPGWRRGNVERYTRGRFIRVTLDRFPLEHERARAAA